MTFEPIDLPEQSYLYVACNCAMEGPAIAAAMEQGFGQVFGFIGAAGITPQSAPMSVYHTMPADGEMAFHCGAIVSAEDAAQAKAPVMAGTLPAGTAMKTMHTGPYAELNKTHGALWAHMEAEKIKGGMPVWEVYIDDPADTPEATLRTEIYCAVG